MGTNGLPRGAILQQYQSKSPHFHTKRDNEHVRRMIAESLGCFLIFKDHLPYQTEQQLSRICEEMQLDITYPLVYPAIEDLPLDQCAQCGLFPVTLHEEVTVSIGE
jgi:mannosyl-3-phosphoglycerate synthase